MKNNRLILSVLTLFLLLVVSGSNCFKSSSLGEGSGDGDNPPPPPTMTFEETIEKSDLNAFKSHQMTDPAKHLIPALKVVKADNPNSVEIFKIVLKETNKSIKRKGELRKLINDEAGSTFEALAVGSEDDKKLLANLMDTMRDEGIFIHRLSFVKNSKDIQQAMCLPTGDKVLYSWTQMGHGKKATIRAIVEGDKCPRVFVGPGFCPVLHVRAAKDASLFPVTSCEMEIGQSAQLMCHGIDCAHDWPIPNYMSDPIAVIGDTGCDTKARQNCDRDWPFEKIAKSVASKEPKLIIHTGDYVYRKIEGSKDSWKVWEADFFKPAKSLFAKAPFVWVRGNHEQCKDSPKGWYRFLAPGPYTGKECDNKSNTIDEPYAINWGDAKLFMLDSSSASDTKKEDTMIDNLVDDLRILNKKAVHDNWKDVWLLTHRPIWSCSPGYGFCDAPADASIRAVWNTWKKEKESDDSRITKILSGHIHLFNAASFKDDGPLQMIVGNSGTYLSGMTVLNINDRSREVENSGYYGYHGYVLMNPLSTNTPGIFQWNVDVFDKQGALHNKLVLEKSKLRKRF